MPSQEQLIQQLLKTIDDSVNAFNEQIPSVQKKAFAKIVKLMGDLDKTGDTVKLSVKNIKIIAQIKKEFEGAIIDGNYKKKVDEFLKSFDDVSDINSQYFSVVTGKFKPSDVFEAIKIASVDSVTENLLGSGIQSNVVNKLNDILIQNVTGSASYEDMIDQVRIFMTDTKEGDGALAKYAKTYTTTALNTYSRQYNETAVSDLGLEWYKYVGSLLTTSRPFCKALIDAKKEGMEFVHKSQFDEFLRGDINGKKVPINKKTGLPEGLEAGTNVSNLAVKAGGWNCGHQFMPVSSKIVPKELLNKFK